MGWTYGDVIDILAAIGVDVTLSTSFHHIPTYSHGSDFSVCGQSFERRLSHTLPRRNPRIKRIKPSNGQRQRGKIERGDKRRDSNKTAEAQRTTGVGDGEGKRAHARQQRNFTGSASVLKHRSYVYLQQLPFLRETPNPLVQSASPRTKHCSCGSIYSKYQPLTEIRRLIISYDQVIVIFIFI